MKKQIAKITLKTDKIVSLTKAQAQNLVGGQRRAGETKWVTTKDPDCI